jgi:hypothetical protein
MEGKKIIMDALQIIFFILAAIFVFWYVFGNSPTFEQTLLMFLSGLIITAIVNIEKVKESQKYLIRDHKELKADYKQFKEKNS